MDLSDFSFDLPDELVAQEPPPIRGASRLMRVSRGTGEIAHSMFSRLGEHLRAGDLLVLNNTRVFPARLLGRRFPSGGGVEALLIRRLPSDQVPADHSDESTGGAAGGAPEWWEALMHPGQKLKVGARVVFDHDDVRLQAEIVGRHFQGRRTIRLWSDGPCSVDEAIDRLGHVPLPPYIKRDDRPSDRERYQTVYARERGSIAAPTAGLHFTPDLLRSLDAHGIELAEVTLHVGYGTFKPIRAARVEDHEVDAETFRVDAPAADALTRARRDGRRIIAVGTTTARVLESLVADAQGRIAAQSGDTSLFIRPGHDFRLLDGLITNFHLPRSSLLVLVAAFAGRERILQAYREAVAQRYRFYSYGDAMVVL